MMKSEFAASPVGIWSETALVSELAQYDVQRFAT
jgi:hypothetical protein